MPLPGGAAFLAWAAVLASTWTAPLVGCQRPPSFTIPNEPPQELQADGEWWFYKLMDLEFPHSVLEALGRGAVAPAGTDPSEGLVSELPEADYVLLEFFAPWCPHCKHFAPEMAKVVKALEEAPGLVKVLSVDCERLEFRDLCSWANANMMPKLAVAKRGVLLGALGATAESTEGVFVKFPVSSAQETMDWLAGVVEDWPQGVPDPEPVDTEAPFFGWSQPAEGASEPQQAPAQDLAVAVVSLLHQAFASLDFGPGAKEALLDLLGLLCAAGPGGGACRESACGMRQSLDANWDSYMHEQLVSTNSEGQPIEPFTSHYLDWARVESEHRWCGRPWPEYAEQGWSWCRGRNPGARGYTCGLWLLFHSLLATAAQAPEFDAVASRRLSELQKPPLEVVRGTVEHFFGCEDCRDNFLAVPVSEADLASGLAQEIWLWKVHNEATARISKEEFEHSANAPPRQQWPTRQSCPSCYGADGNWDLDEVGKRLVQFYGAAGLGSPLRALVDKSEARAAQDVSSGEQPVNVQVFYFPLCPHCQQFLEYGLLPLVEAGLSSVQLTTLPIYPPMLPMVDAAEAECRSDDACFLALAPLCAWSDKLEQPAPANDPRFLRAVRFAACDMDGTASGAGRSEAAAKDCAGKGNLTWSGADGVQACAESSRAFQLLEAASRKLEDAMYLLHDDMGMESPPSMPWVVVDKEFYYWEDGACLAKTSPSGKRTQVDPPLSLLQLVCSKLSPRPAACDAAAAQGPAKTGSTEQCENCAEVGSFQWRRRLSATSFQLPALATGVACVAAMLVCAARRPRSAPAVGQTAADDFAAE